ncbi:hypothetical protein EDI_185570 [Entamoeba dispar SAW760]|uniref:Uncharacterized protein n=1 Tax=Entamoeba dispar (strain ATCC PRA-260 / SAW760) TaxID=370354 RepID=B0EVE8_ENTDS|nr:uncharacterized protein EDI_185570 [Entamoeba dispar SAW760]EDR21498.1 hypothetical protein EDI_185570 [Entamoeba dispar SAW760]|eukprot:EDR21498.1 hypothetical protein EDI_185570 [Entamoeba dispar SAW760]
MKTTINYPTTVISEKDYEYTIKLLFVGDISTFYQRKSLLWQTYKRDLNSQDLSDFPLQISSSIEINGRIGKIVFTSYNNFIGRETSYFPFKGIHILCVVFDFSNDSIKNIGNWIEEGKRFSGNRKMYTLIIGLYDNLSNSTNIPTEVSDILLKDNTIEFYSYNKLTTLNLFNKLEQYYIKIRSNDLTDDVIDKQIAKEKEYKQRRTISQTGILNKTFSSSPINQEDKKRTLINFNKSEIIITIKTIILGDSCISDFSKRLCTGLSIDWNTSFNLYSFDDYPPKILQIDNKKTLKLRTYVYDHSIRKGASYTPYFNVLGVILCFDYQKSNTFANLMNWYNETLRYCNLKSTHYIIVGFNKSNNSIVTDDDVQGFVNFFPMNKRPHVFCFDESKTHEFDLLFEEFCLEINAMEFSQPYLDKCKPQKEDIPKSRLQSGRSQRTYSCVPSPQFNSNESLTLIEHKHTHHKKEKDCVLF